jgi:hypothetical protein
MIRPRGQTGFARAKAKTKALLDVRPTVKALAYVVDDRGWGLKQRMGHIQSESGNPFLLHHYRGLAAELERSAAIDVTILVTSLVGQGEMVPHAPFADLPATSRQRAVAQVEAERHRFAGEFADVASEDLAVTGIFWVGVRRSA